MVGRIITRIVDYYKTHKVYSVEQEDSDEEMFLFLRLIHKDILRSVLVAAPELFRSAILRDFVVQGLTVSRVHRPVSLAPTLDCSNLLLDG